MKQNNENNTRTYSIIACGIFFIAYAGCYHSLINSGYKKAIYKPKPKTEYISNYTSNNISGQRARKTIKSIKIIPSTETYEVSRWIESGDWSHDDDPLTVTIPSQKIVVDIDYVENNWDDFLADPEDELQYPPDLFQ